MGAPIGQHPDEVEEGEQIPLLDEAGLALARGEDQPDPAHYLG